jgi:hypothetical protein
MEKRESFGYKMLCLRNGEEGGRLCFGIGGGLVWWQNLNKIRADVGMLDEGWLLGNIHREVEDESSTLFWRYPWLDDFSIEIKFRKLFELADNELANVANTHFLGSGSGI